MSASSEPAIDSPKPSRMMRMRPSRSARPPITTVKMPENSEVSDTATFIVPEATPRSRRMSGATFSMVWANSQKVTSPAIMPNSSRSLPWKAAAGGAADGVVMARGQARAREMMV